MRLIYCLNFLLISFSLALFSSCQNNSEQLSLEHEQQFVFEAYPLLETKCFSCHANDPDEIEGAYDMRTRHGLLDGGESGQPAVVAGAPEESPLYKAIRREEEDFAMPPKADDKLDENQISILKTWIKNGAPYVEADRRKELFEIGGYKSEGMMPVRASGGITDAWTNRNYALEDLWAYMPLTDIVIPDQNEEDGHPIDAFVEAKLNSIGLHPGEQADSITLIRRVTFDLTGLPPSNFDIENFLNDDSSDAWNNVIERLLASPQYGEQWGRHWLDIVRYADSDGFANDYLRPHAWRYRDYVIRSFNEDKPYDQFIREQIAGDELDPSKPENLIATSYLRMGPWEHTSMSVEAVTRQFYLDDASHNIGEVFLAQPLNCARCHDHKYDPIPTRDVYSMQANLATTQFADRPAAFLPSENLNGMERQKARLEGLMSKTNEESKRLDAKYEAAVKKWFNARGQKYKDRLERRKLPEDAKPQRYLGLTNQELGYRKLLDKRRQRYSREIAKFDPMAYSVYNGPRVAANSHRPMRVPESVEGEAAKTYILTGGSVYAKAEEVQPGILTAVSAMQRDFLQEHQDNSLEISIPSTMDKRRLNLANWIASSDNPLTTRVIVNRIWQHHFGKGIAENSNNFGGTGKKPSHPDLLDWLAKYFVSKGWSFKEMHRLILTSRAYQRSGNHKDNETIKRKDPDNKYLAVYSPRRLDADEIRDATLFVSGELNPTMGGLPISPEIHQEVALQPRHVMGSVAPAYQASPTKAERNRRTIYALRLRGLQNPLLEVFNRPTPDFSCERRTTSTVTPQVFMLFNDQFVRDRSVALANKVAHEVQNESEQIEDMFLSIYNRAPSNSEIEKARAYISGMLNYHEENDSPIRAYPQTVEREMFEEMTGESFSWVEDLDIYENYERDLHMSDVEPATRALADLAVVLINSNEFMYVY